MNIRSPLTRLKTCTQGIAALEFALILPVMLLLFVGLAEIGRYALFVQKVDKATHDMADLITQNNSVTLAMLNGYADALDRILDPFNLNGTVIVSSVAALSAVDADANDAALNLVDEADIAIIREGCRVACVVWQWKRGNDNSVVGTTGGAANLPGGYTINDATQNVLVVELINRYESMTGMSDGFINTIVGPTRRIVVYKPRTQENVGDMTTPPT